MAEIDHDAAITMVRASGALRRDCGEHEYVADLAERAKRLEEALRAIAERRHPSGDQTQFADISDLRDYACAALASKDKP